MTTFQDVIVEVEEDGPDLVASLQEAAQKKLEVAAGEPGAPSWRMVPGAFIKVK